jgi:hypothetical protein
VLLKLDLDVQQTLLGLLNKRLFLAAALGVTEFIAAIALILGTLSCAT